MKYLSTILNKTKESIALRSKKVRDDFFPPKQAWNTFRTRFKKSDFKKPKTKKQWLMSILYNTFVMGLVVVFIFPTVWMLVSTTKTEAAIIADINTLGAFWFENFNVSDWFASYRQVFARFNLFNKMAFSFQYAFFLILGTVLVNSMAGYALAKFNFPFKNFWMAFIITLIIVPVETTIIPLYVVADRFGLVGKFAGLFIPGLGNAFNIFLFRQFFVGIPKELEEAALIDGASRFTIFFRVIMPLSKPVFATVSIFAFIGAWNDFLWPILVLGGNDLMPLQVYLTEMINTYPVYMNQVLAALTISTIPIVFIYIFFQKYIVQGIANTGIK